MFYSLLSIAVFSCVVLFVYSIYGFGLILHYDVWVGRGLYPGLAMAKGADLYQPMEGPHVTLYGPGCALFYATAAIASTPEGAIWIAYLINVLSLFLVLSYLLNHIFLKIFPVFKVRILAIIPSFILLTAIFLLEPSTAGVLKVHADMPAYFFLLLSLCFFHSFIQQNKKVLIWSTCVLLSLSVWSKIPTLPATIFPFLFFIIKAEFVNAFSYIFRLLLSFLIVSSVFFSLYGYEDTIFILFKHVEKADMWGFRNTLFGGPNTWIRMGYIEATPLLLRYFVMYLAEYWYIACSFIISGYLILRLEKKSSSNSIHLNLFIIYMLTLPPCLVALAHYGSVENALLFANATGLLLLFSSTILHSKEKFSSKGFLFLLWSLALIFSLPLARIAKSAPSDSSLAPHQVAYEYLRKGNDDIFFGWYPISHLLHSGKIYTSIEAPMHLNETMPDSFKFSTSHFPENAKYLGTSSISGSGGMVLPYYLGKLKEEKTPAELKGWRLYEPIE